MFTFLYLKFVPMWIVGTEYDDTLLTRAIILDLIIGGLCIILISL